MQYETALFLQSALLGAVLLLCYDMLRIFRRVWRHSSAAVAAEDLLFWVLTGLLVFAVIYRNNQGSIRAFLFLGIFLGMWLYHVAISTFFVSFFVKVLEIPMKLVKKIRKVLLFWVKRGNIYVYIFAQKTGLYPMAARRLRSGKRGKVRQTVNKKQKSK